MVDHFEAGLFADRSQASLAVRCTVKLPLGITGIQSRKGPFPDSPPPDRIAFRSHCHSAARSVGAKLLGIEDPDTVFKMCNYAVAHFEFDDGAIAVMLNLIHPILAFAKRPLEGQIVFEFVDCPKLAAPFAATGLYTIASREEMNRLLLREMWVGLAPAEQKQIRGFRPERVGDVIFNY